MQGETFQETAQMKSLQALLVEDDDLDAQILTHLAGLDEHLDLQFTRARSVAEAKRITRNTRFDMYFVDLHIDGATTLRLLADLEQEGACPIVLSNATAMEIDRYRLDTGGLRFLSKPQVTTARIGALVREALAAKSALTS